MKQCGECKETELGLDSGSPNSTLCELLFLHFSQPQHPHL